MQILMALCTDCPKTSSAKHAPDQDQLAPDQDQLAPDQDQLASQLGWCSITNKCQGGTVMQQLCPGLWLPEI